MSLSAVKALSRGHAQHAQGPDAQNCTDEAVPPREASRVYRRSGRERLGERSGEEQAGAGEEAPRSRPRVRLAPAESVASERERAQDIAEVASIRYTLMAAAFICEARLGG